MKPKKEERSDRPKPARGRRTSEPSDPALETTDRFRDLAKAVWAVQEEEQRRLVRALHDGLGQTLVALGHQLECLCEDAGGAASPEFAARLGEGVEMVRTALRESRELSRLLRPPVLDDFGLAMALSSLARTLRRRGGFKVDLRLEGLEERLPADIETLAFRLIQEALDNVLRHAGVDRARVRVKRAGQSLALRVSDTGRGFDPLAVLAGDGAVSGLRGMRDRLELFGGVLELVSAPGRGTRLSAEVLWVEEPR